MDKLGGELHVFSQKDSIKDQAKNKKSNLWKSVGTARFIYNWTLSKQEENYKNGGKFI